MGGVGQGAGGAVLPWEVLWGWGAVWCRLLGSHGLILHLVHGTVPYGRPLLPPGEAPAGLGALAAPKAGGGGCGGCPYTPLALLLFLCRAPKPKPTGRRLHGEKGNAAGMRSSEDELPRGEGERGRARGGRPPPARHEGEASPASLRCRRRTESLQVIKRRLRKSPASRRNGAGESWRGG